ncbi:MAG: DUF3833 family protein [Chthoniobacterales bacterium]
MRLVLLLLATLFSACAGMRPSDFARGKPTLDPVEYFTGQSSSIGVLENRRGQPTQQVATQTRGTITADTLHLEQDLQFSDGKKQHRSWQLRRIDAHHFEGRANDIIGLIHGEAAGHVFHWSFTLELSPGNPLTRVRMSQWMYLQPDGRTLLNHSTISKAGIVLAQVTENFRREKPVR